MAYSEADKVLVNVLRQEMVVGGGFIEEFTNKLLVSVVCEVVAGEQNSDQMVHWMANPTVVEAYGADCSVS